MTSYQNHSRSTDVVITKTIRAAMIDTIRPRSWYPRIYPNNGLNDAHSYHAYNLSWSYHAAPPMRKPISAKLGNPAGQFLAPAYHWRFFCLFFGNVQAGLSLRKDKILILTLSPIHYFWGAMYTRFWLGKFQLWLKRGWWWWWWCIIIGVLWIHGREIPLFCAHIGETWFF